MTGTIALAVLFLPVLGAHLNAPGHVSAQVAGLGSVLAQRRPITSDPLNIIDLRKAEMLCSKRVWIFVELTGFVVVEV